MNGARAGTWVLISGGATVAAAWFILGSSGPFRRACLGLAVVVFGLHPFGALWMMHHSVRYERQPLPFVAPSLVPYTFVAYYFKRVRKAGHAGPGSSRSQRAGGGWRRPS
jgi:hypothetical protein